MSYSTLKLTQDTDNGRVNSSPSLVILPSGQQFAFYSKFLTTGKTSFSRISFTSPSLIVNVEAGTGNINGTPVTWGAVSKTASQNSFQLVYVDNLGNVGIGSNLSMTFLNDKIILAYVSSGSSSITKIYEFEHTGNYIYVRKQTLTGSVWIWNDYEEILNTGTDPACFYNSVQNRIYLNYKKDSASYVRIFNPSDELTWEYLANITVTAGTITLNRDPENTFGTIGHSSGHVAYSKLISSLFIIGASGFAYDPDNLYVFLPTLSGDFNNYISSDITYDFFYKVNGTYILEASYSLKGIYSVGFYDRYRVWTGTTGVKYVGIRVYTRLYLSQYISEPDDYSSFEIYTPPAKIVVTDGYTIDSKDKIFNSSLSSGYKAYYTKPSEFSELKEFDTDTYSKSAVSSGYITYYSKTSEFMELKEYKNDIYAESSVSSGYSAYFVINSIAI